MIRGYSSEGIVLARKNYSEADRILIVYSKNFGKLSLLAKGVRHLTSKKRGSIEVFSLLKFSAVKTNSLDIITEAQLVDSFSDIRTDLRKVALAYYYLEVVGRIVHEGEKNIELFEILLTSIEEIKSSTNLKKSRVKFIYEILTQLGFWPYNVELKDPDRVLEDVLERKVNSVRVGKKILT